MHEAQQAVMLVIKGSLKAADDVNVAKLSFRREYCLSVRITCVRTNLPICGDQGV